MTRDFELSKLFQFAYQLEQR